MTLKGLRGLKKFQSAGVALGFVLALLLASFVYAELASFGSAPRTPASVNDISIHGWKDYARPLLNLTDIDIKNNSYTNYTCNATMCTLYTYLDNDNYTKQRGIVFIANFSKSNVYFNDSEGVWRNISDLSYSQGRWNYSSAQAGYAADADTVLLLKFDETSGPYANDSTRYGNNGTFVNGPNRTVNEITNSTNCILGNCLSFDGSDDYVSVPRHSSIEPAAITVEFWMKSSDVGPQRFMIDKPYTSHNPPYYSYTISQLNSKIYLDIAIDGVAKTINSVGNISTGVWVHVATTYDGSNMRIYLNGVLDTSTAAAGAITYYAKDWGFGRLSNAAGYNYAGLLDEVKIVNRSLSAEEIRAEYYKRWNMTTVNYELGAGDGYDSGIRDVQPASSYWLDEFGNSLETGLAGYWKMSEGAGTTTADASGYGNTGTLTNMNTSNPDGTNGNTTSGWNASGRFGNALRFDGVNDYVNVTRHSSFEPANAITLEAWIKPATTNNGGIIEKAKDDGAHTAPYFSWDIEVTSAKVIFYLTTSGVRTGVTSLSSVSADTWLHITATYDGSDMRLFLNGKQEATTAKSGSINYYATNLVVGYLRNVGYYFNGIIDEVRIYNRALTPDEIKRLYDSSAIKLKNDFTTVAQSAYLQMNMTNYTGQTIFNTPAEEIKVDGNPISNIYTPVNGSHTTYFYDWKQNDWAVWAKEAYGKGLVGWWKFDEGAGNKANDWSNYGNAGTLTNMNTSNPGGGNGNASSGWNASGKFGNALVFDGVNDYVNYSSSTVPLGAKTIGFWVKTASYATGTGKILNTMAGSGTNGIVIQISDDSLQVLSGKGVVGTFRYDTTTSNTNVNDGNWHYFAHAWDGTTNPSAVKTYVDGVLINQTVADSTETTAASLNLVLGQYSNNSLDPQSWNFNGTLDDVKIWNRSLSAEEVRLEYENKIKQGAPDFNDPRFKEQFRWRDEFKRDTYPGINITYAMTAQDPFVRTMVDANATGEYGPGEGVVGIWHFNEGSGTTAYDQSGYANTGTLTNMNTSNPGGGNGNWTSGWNASGKFGNALQFDSVNDYVGLSSTAIPTGSTPDITIEGWVNARNKSNLQCMVSMGQAATENTHISVCLNTNSQEIYIGHWGAAFDFNTRVRVPLNSWNHIAYTLNSTNHDSVYLNGVLVNSSSTTVTVGSNPTVAIGRWDDKVGNFYYFNGTIDEVRIYNRSLTAAEIKKIYEGRHNISIPLKFVELKNTLDEGLVLYAPFEEASGTSAYDYSGNSNTGTLTNMTIDSPAEITLLSNGDFETGSPPTGWSSIGSATLSRDGSIFKTGSYSLKMTSTGNPNVDVGSVQSIANYANYAGKAVTLGTWYRVSSTNATDASFRILIDDGVAYTSSGSLIEDDAWHWITFSRTISGSPTYLWITYQAAYGQSGTATTMYADGAIFVQDKFDEKSGWNASGRFGNALALDGVNDFVVSANNIGIEGLQDRTIEFWVKSATTDYSTQGHAVGWGTWNNFVWWSVVAEGATATWKVYDGSGLYNSGKAVSATDWQHVVATLTGTNRILKIYVDGVQYGGDLTVSASAGTSNTQAIIGSNLRSPKTQFFNGTIDDVRIYNRSLSLEEVKQLYYLGQTKLKPGNYYYRNTSSESVLWTAQNFREAYRGKYSEGLGSLFSVWSNATAKTATYNYDFNSTINQHFLYSQGYTNSINASAFNPATSQLGFSSEPLESVVNSSLSYYDLQDNDLVLWLKMNDGWGALNASDASGWGNNGVLTNMNVTGNASSGWNNTNCKTGFGMCMNFDRVDDYVNISRASSLEPQEFTLGAWVKLNSYSPSASVIFSKDQTSHIVPYYSYHLRISDLGAIHFEWNNGTTNQNLDGSSVSTGEWTHLAVTYKAGEQRVYKNGVIVLSSARSDTIAYYNTNLIIGTSLNLGSNYATNGTIDDVKIWRRALSADEIKSMYESQAEEYPNYFKVDKTSAVQHSKVVSQKYDGSLVGWWKFDEGMNTSAGDSSGMGNNGTLVGMNTSNPGGGNGNWTSGWNASGKFGNALVFDGVNDYVNVLDSNSLDISSAITVEAWYYPRGNADTQYAFVSKHNTTSPSGYYFFYKNAASDYRFGLYIGNGTNWVSAGWTTKNYTNINTWYHVASTFDGTNWAMYVNGLPDGSGAISPTTIAVNTYNLEIGRDRTSLGWLVNGTIDDVKIYPRALTADEIKQQYLQTYSQYYDDFNSQPSAYVGVEDSPDNGLVGYWKFDEGVGASAKDESGLGNAGTLTNMNTSNPGGGNGNWTSGWNASGKFGNALVFDANDYVNVPHSASLNITSAITLGAWVYPTSNGVHSRIIAKYGSGYSYVLGRHGTAIYFALFTQAGAQTYFDNAGNVPLNTWSYVAATWNGATMRAFVNGIDTGVTASFAGPIGTNTVPVTMGLTNSDSSYIFTGTIDEVQIWNRSLTSTEIYNEYIAKNAYFNKRNATPTGVTHTVKTIGNQTTIDYNLTDHDIAGQYDYDQRLLKIEGVAGDAQPHLNVTTWPARYSTTQATWFNISVEPCAQWCNATLEANFTGAYANYTMSRGINNQFYYNLTTPVGIDQYRFYVQTSDYNWRVTDYYTISQVKSTPVLIIHNNTASINTSGLVGYWRFEQSNGSAATNDSSGYGNMGTLTNMNLTGNSSSGITTNGRFGNALQFDGVNDYVVIGDNSALNFSSSDFTISFWLKFNSVQSGYVNIMGQAKQHTAPSNRRWWISKTSTPGFHFNSATTQNASFGGTDFTWSPVANTWYYIVVTRNGATGTVYSNNAVLGTWSAVDIYTGSTADLWLGHTEAEASEPRWVNGTFDEVQIWNRSLTAGEINLLYQSNAVYGNTTLMLQQPYKTNGDTNLNTYTYRNQSLVQNDTGLVGYWNLDNNTNDYSGYGNNGVMIGNNATPATGRFGQAYDFDGVDDFVGLSNTAIPTGATPDITIEGWIFTKNKTTAMGCIVGIGQAATTNTHIGLCLSATLQELLVDHWGGGLNSRARVPLNSWNHIAYTLNSTNHDSLYLNGVLVNSSSTTVTVGSNPKVVMGSWDDIAGNLRLYSFNGTLDEVRIYNRALSASEITEMYNQTRPAGYEYYLVNTTGNANYTAQEFMVPLNITQAVLTGSLYINGSQANTNYVYGQIANATATTGTRINNEGTLYLLRNGTEVGIRNGANFAMNETLLGASLYNYTAAWVGSNYTFSNITYSLAIAKATPVLILNNNTASINTSGLVGYWRFEQSNGSAATNDSSGYGNMGTLTGMNLTGNATSGLTQGRFGNALNFDGVNDYVNLGDIGNNLKTIGFWIKPNSNNESVMDFNGNQFLSYNGFPEGFDNYDIYIDGVLASDSQTVTNGNADSLTGWTVNNGAGGGSTTINGGTIQQAEGSSSVDMTTYQTLSLTQGNLYRYSFAGVSENVDGAPEANFYIGTGAGSSSVLAVEWGISGAKTYSGTFVAGATNVLSLMNRGAANRIVRWDNITIKKVVNNATANQWHHVIVIANITINSNTSALGKRSNNFFNGTIDEVMIWNRSLTANEIQMLYQSNAVYGNTTLMLQQPNKGTRNADSNLVTTTYRNQTYVQNDTGLVGYWGFEDVSGQNTTGDKSGYGNNGNLSAGMNLTGNSTSGWNATACRFGSCLNFDGVNDFVVVPDSSSWNFGSGDFTIGAWANFRSLTQPSTQNFVAQWGDAGSNGAFAFVIDAGATLMFFWSTTGSSELRVDGSWSPSLNTWYHVVAVRSGTSIKTYVNAVEKGSGTLSGTIYDSTRDLNMGAYRNGGQLFNGAMDEVRVYNRALSVAEILELYNQTRPAGYEYYLLNTTGNANYTAQEFAVPLSVSKATPTLQAGFNVSSGIPYGEPVLVYGNTSNQEVQTDATLAIRLNGTQVNSGTGNRTYGLLLFAGINEFNLTSGETANYTGSSLNRTDFNVSKSTPILALSQNNSFPAGSGLVGYWSFDENATATAYDSSGKNNDGTLTSMGTGLSATSGRNTTNCKYGNCLVFDGVNDNVNIGNIGIPQNGPATIEFWFYFNQIASQKGSGIGFFQFNGGTNSGIYQHQANNYLYSDTDTDQAWSTPISARTWYHIAFTYNGAWSTAKLYLNGVQQGNVNTPSSQSIVASGIAFGMTRGGIVGYFNGSIDEVRIYNYSMTQAEIQAAMNATINDFPITYPNATNVTGYVRLGDNSTSLGLYRNGTQVGGGHSVVSENLTLLAAGIHAYNLTYPESQNYSARNLTRILSIPKATAPTLNLYLNGTQSSVFYVYGQPTNATATKTATRNNEGLLQLWRNGTSIGSGGPDNVSELILLGAGIYNYSATFGDARGNYTNTSILSSRDVTMSQAHPVIIISNGTQNGAINTSGLVGYWRFEQSNGSAATNDSSGYGNMGTLTNMNLTGNSTSGLTQGRFGNALQFDGVNDYVITSNVGISGTSVRTLSLWVKLSSINDYQVFARWGTSGNGQTFGIGYDLGAITFHGWGTADFSFGSAMTIGNWYYLAVTYDGTTVRTYVNGVAGNTGTPSLNTGDAALYIGDQAPSAYPTNGTIDEVQVWNRSLTADEVLMLNNSKVTYGNATLLLQMPNKGTRNADANLNTYTYRNQSLIQNDTGLVGYWKFDNESSNGATAADSSGYGNTGTLTNMNTTGNATSGWNDTCRFGKCLNFDRINDYVQTGATVSFNTNNVYTAMAWIYPTDSGDSPARTFLSLGSQSDGNIYLDEFGLRDLTLRFANYAGAWTASAGTLTLNTWNHVALIHDGANNNVKIYLNGVLGVDAAYTTDLATTTGRATIGALNSNTPSEYFNGTIDEVRIYNRALSAAEIREVYQQTRPSGTEYYLANTTGNANYTSMEFLLPLYVGGTLSSLSVGFNATSGIPYGTPLLAWANISATAGDQSATVTLYINGTQAKQGAGNQTYSYLPAAGIYNFSAYYSESQNYTNSTSIDNNFVVQRSTPILALSQNNSFPAASGLVGYWSFDENTTFTTYDQSGFGNDGTLTNMNLSNSSSGRNFTCKFGNCLNFDGVNDYVEILDGTWITTAARITVMGWAKTDTSITAARMIANRELNPGGFALGAGWTANRFTIYINAAGWAEATGTTAIATDTWYHVAGVYDGSNVILYVNGVQEDTTAKTGNMGGGVRNVNIGRNSESGGNLWDGSIDEVRVYNYSMTQAEVQASMNATIYDLPITYPNATNVTGYVRLGDNSTSLGLYRNGTQVGGGHSVVSENLTLLAAGIHAYNLTYPESQNYSARNLTRVLSIPQGSVSLNLYLNGTQASQTYRYPNATNATGTASARWNNEGNLSLLRNGTMFGISVNSNMAMNESLLPASIYNFSLTFNASNYSYTSILSGRDLTMEKGNLNVIIYLNSSYASANNTNLTYPNATIVNATAMLFLGNKNATLFRNLTLISSATHDNLTLGAGRWNYTAYYSDENYTLNSTQLNLTILKAATHITLLLNASDIASRDYNRSEIINITAILGNRHGFLPSESKIFNISINFTGAYPWNYTETAVTTTANRTLNNITTHDTPGAYNVTAWFDEDANYSSSYRSKDLIIYGNLYVNLILPTQTTYNNSQNISMNVTVSDYLRGDYPISLNVTANLTSLYTWNFANAPYYSQNVNLSVYGVSDAANWSASEPYNLTDLHAGNWSLNITASRNFYRTGRNFTTIVVDRRIYANASGIQKNATGTNITINEMIQINGSLTRLGNMPVNGTFDLNIKRMNLGNIGLIVSDASTINFYEGFYNKTLAEEGYNVTIVDDNDVNSGVWTPSQYDLIFWGEASYDNFFLQYIDDNIYGQIVAGKPVMMTYYGMIKGAIDLNLSTAWGGLFARDIYTTQIHSITDNYTHVNVSNAQDSTYNSLYLHSFKGTELGNDNTAGRTIIGVNSTLGGRVAVFGAYRADQWTTEAEDMFLRSIYWALTGSEQTLDRLRSNITVPYTLEEYFDESDGNATGFGVLNGTWSIRSGEYNQTDQALAWHKSLTRHNITDAAIDAKVKVVSYGVNSSAGILLRWSGANSGYACSLTNGTLGTKVVQLEKLGASLLNYTVFAWSDSTYYTLKLEAKGSSVRCYVDGSLKSEASDTSYATGTAGLFSYGAVATFDNMRVFAHAGNYNYGKYYFKRNWYSGLSAPGHYRATATFDYWNETGNRTVLEKTLDFNISAVANASINVSLNKYQYSFKESVTIAGALNATGNTQATGNFSIEVWNSTHLITMIQNTTRTISPSSNYSISETWNVWFNRSANYSVLVNYSWTGGSVKERANFTVVYNVSADVNVTVNRLKYNYSQIVTVNTSIWNKVEASMTGVRIDCSATDPDGALAASAFTSPALTNATLGTIASNANASNTTTWNVTNKIYGTYTVRCNVTEASGFIDFDTEAFAITTTNATLTIQANKTGNYTVNDAIGVLGNVSAIGGLNATGTLTVEVYNASTRMQQLYSGTVTTAGGNLFNITAQNLVFRTYYNFSGSYTLNATFTYTDDAQQTVTKASSTTFNISYVNNVSVGASADKASYLNTETVTITSTVTNTGSDSITNGNLTIRIYNSSAQTDSALRFWNSSFYNISTSSSATRTDAVSISGWSAGTHYITANFSFGTTYVNVSATFTITSVTTASNFTVRLLAGDHNYTIFTTQSGTLASSRANNSEYQVRWIVSYFNDSALGFYGTGGGVSVTAANSSTRHSVAVNALIRDSKLYAIFTKGDRTNVADRALLLDSGKFSQEINPTFGFPLSDKNTLSLKLKYTDVDIQGIGTLQKGTYKLRIENNGTVSGKTAIAVSILP